MTFLCTGVAVPALGFQCHSTAVPDGGIEGFQVRKHYSYIDPLQLRSIQPPKVLVDLEHGRDILGQVEALEIGRNGALWATATLHGPCPQETNPDLYWSISSNRRRDGGDVLITRIAIVDNPAMIGAEPIQFIDVSELREHPVSSAHGIDPYVRDVLLRAAKAKAKRRPGDPIRVHDLDTKRADERDDREYAMQMRGARVGPIRHGPPGRILNVR